MCATVGARLGDDADLARLLETDQSELRTRLVLVRVGERSAALLVGSVIGVRSLEPSVLSEMPPLLRGVSAQLITGIGSLDSQLLRLLGTSRMVPESAWANLEAGGAVHG